MIRQNVSHMDEDYMGAYEQRSISSSDILQKFACDFVTICRLEVLGKISTADADRQIRTLWNLFQGSQT